MNAQEFLKTYVAAFDAFDPTAIARHYHYPSLLASTERVSAFLGKGDAEERFSEVCDFHRRIGYHHAEANDIEVETLTDNLWHVTVAWRFLSKSDDELMNFRCTYSIADYGSGPKIVCALVHG